MHACVWVKKRRVIDPKYVATLQENPTWNILHPFSSRTSFLKNRPVTHRFHENVFNELNKIKIKTVFSKENSSSMLNSIYFLSGFIQKCSIISFIS